MAQIKVFQVYIPDPLRNGTIPALIETAVNPWLEENDGKIEIVNISLVDIVKMPYAWVMVVYKKMEKLPEIKKEAETPKIKTEPPKPIVLPR